MRGGLRTRLVAMLPTRARLAIRRVRFRGTAETCPLCESSIAAYRDFGAGHPVLETRRVVGGMRRSADICPVCYGASRARLIALYLDTVAGVGRRDLRMLHLAPDIGVYYWLRGRRRLDYVSADLEPERYSIVPDVRRADVTALAFDDASFDIVIASHVLEHVPDDRRAMREIRRVLRPEGEALLMAPEATDGRDTDEDPTIEDRRERIDRFGQGDHVRLYGREDFVARLGGAGFTMKGFTALDVDPALAASWRLDPMEALRVGRPAPAADLSHVAGLAPAAPL